MEFHCDKCNFNYIPHNKDINVKYLKAFPQYFWVNCRRCEHRLRMDMQDLFTNPAVVGTWNMMDTEQDESVAVEPVRHRKAVEPVDDKKKVVKEDKKKTRGVIEPVEDKKRVVVKEDKKKARGVVEPVKKSRGAVEPAEDKKVVKAVVSKEEKAVKRPLDDKKARKSPVAEHARGNGKRVAAAAAI